MANPRSEGEQAYRESDTPLADDERLTPLYEQGLRQEDLRSEELERQNVKRLRRGFGVRETTSRSLGR